MSASKYPEIDYAEISFGRYEHVGTALDELSQARETLQLVRELRTLQRKISRRVRAGMDCSEYRLEARRLAAFVDAALGMHVSDGI